MVRKSCLGCVHYRSLSDIVSGARCCCYILDTNGEPRGCDPDKCTKKEAAQGRPEKNERIKLCDDYSIAQIGYIVKEDKTI